MPDSVAQLEHEFALLARRLEATRRSPHTTLPRAHYLLLLRLADGPVSIGTLAAELGLDGSTVTRQINAMHRAGLVEKRPNPIDKRGALIERTAHGTTAAVAARQERLTRIATRFATWPESDRAELAKWLRRLNALLEE